MENLNVHIVRSNSVGLLHDSRGDVKKLAYAINSSVDKINEMVKAINRLERANNRLTEENEKLSEQIKSLSMSNDS
jgi:hypothetical protein